MPDLASSQLDFLVYVIPGYVLLLAAVYTWLPERFTAARDHLGAGEVLGSAVAALLIGIFIHQIATSALNLADDLFGWPTYNRIVQRFAHVEQVRAKLKARLGFAPTDVADCYFYGRVLVAEQAPRTAESAERLLRLANVCQNMLLAVPLAAIVVSFSRPLRTRKWWLRFGIPLALSAAIDAVFFYGLIMYWTAAAWRVLRATLLLV